MESKIRQNARDLEQELAWFARVLDTRFKLYFGQEVEPQNVFEIPPPDLGESGSAYAHFVQHYQLAFAERFAVVLSLVPHVRPQLLDVFFTKNKTFDRRFTEFGGVWRSAEGLAQGAGGGHERHRRRGRAAGDPQGIRQGGEGFVRLTQPVLWRRKHVGGGRARGR